MAIADNAAYYRKAGEILASWGWAAYIDWYTGWATRSNAGATMLPRGITVHHTGSRATATSYLVNPRDRPALKVLANVHITHDHRIKFICAGGASHGGYTDQAVYEKLIAGNAPLDRDMVPGSDSRTFSINKRTVGIEIDGAGGVREWDTWTYRAAVATSAALHLAGKFPVGTAPRVGAHKEHTKRKPGDPYCNMGQFRKDVLSCLQAPWGPAGGVGTKPLKLGDRILSKMVGQDTGADVAELAKLLIARGYDLGKPADVFGPKMEAAVKWEQKKAGLVVDGIVGPKTVAKLLGGAVEPEPTPPVVAEPPEPQPEPEPEPEPESKPEPKPEPPAPKPNAVDFRYGWANLHAQRWGGLADRSPKRAAFIKSELKASVLGCCEMSETARNATFRALGGWKNYPIGYVSSGWNPKKWTHIARKSVSFGTAYHGAVRAELRHVASGKRLDVISLHVRPRASFRSDAAAAKGKQSDIAAALTLVRPGVPTIFAGDFNTTATSAIAKKGLRLAVKKAGTHRKTGKFLDQVWVSKELVVRHHSLVSSVGVSDHDAWTVGLSIPDSTL